MFLNFSFYYNVQIGSIMTPIEVLNEIQKMPLTEKHRVFEELNAHLYTREQPSIKAGEEKFIDSLRRKGLLTELPLSLPDDELRRNFKRIDVEGEPLSVTIIGERG
jgi:hypothetical protein